MPGSAISRPWQSGARPRLRHCTAWVLKPWASCARPWRPRDCRSRPEGRERTFAAATLVFAQNYTISEAHGFRTDPMSTLLFVAQVTGDAASGYRAAFPDLPDCAVDAPDVVELLVK